MGRRKSASAGSSTYVGESWAFGRRYRRLSQRIRKPIATSVVLAVLMTLTGPTAFAEDPPADTTTEAPATESPSPEPSPSTDPAPEPTPSAEPSVEPSPEPTTAPEPSPEPSATSEPTPEPSPSAAPSVTDSLIVRLVPGLSSADTAGAIAVGGGVETSAIPALRMHVVDVARATSADSIAAYRADPRVDSVDRDRVREVEATPDDPSYSSQWALPQIGWDQAYGVTAPAGSATLAVLDTGVDAVGDLSIIAGYSALGGGTSDAERPRHVDGLDRRSHRQQRHRHRRRRLRRRLRDAGQGSRRGRHRPGLRHHRRRRVGCRSRRRRRS